MKRMLFLIAASVLASSLALYAQESGGTLTSDLLDKQEKGLDDQYMKITKDIEKIVSKYKLMGLKDIRLIPYQTTLTMGSDFIQVEKHNFIKDEERGKDVVGIKTRTIKLYTNGSSISKIETTIYEKHYYSSEIDKVIIVDPSPTSGGLEDITFTHQRRSKILVKDRKMQDVKNSTAYPVRNELKRMFMIPTLSMFKDALLFIAEGYYQSLKDSDERLSDFLKTSTNY